MVTDGGDASSAQIRTVADLAERFGHRIGQLRLVVKIELLQGFQDVIKPPETSPVVGNIEQIRRELGEGLRTWQAIFQEKGYIPTGLGAGDWDRFSDSGGCAHLIAACAQWLLVLEGKNDWSLHNVPALLLNSYADELLPFAAAFAKAHTNYLHGS